MTTATPSTRRSPLPIRALRTLRNAVPRLLLRSPAHRLLSSRYLELEFTGRRSGRRYRTPVAYVRSRTTLLSSTDSRWWHNLVDGPPVRVLLTGAWQPGRARLLSGEEAQAALRRLVDEVPGYAATAGISRVGRVPDETLAALVDERRRVVFAVEVDR